MEFSEACIEDNHQGLTTADVLVPADSDALEYDGPMSKQQNGEIFRRLKNLDDGLQKLEEARAATGSPASTRESWFKRNGFSFALIGTSIALVTWLVGNGVLRAPFALYVDSRVNSGLRPLTEKITQLQVDVGEIKGELKRIADLRTIEDSAGASPAQLAKHLEKLRNVLVEARRTAEPLPDQAVSEIQAKLLKVDAASPGYWPLVFDLISYRSIIVTGLTSPPVANAIEFTDVAANPLGKGVLGGYLRLGGIIDGVRFEGSWIEFDANRPVKLKNVHFDHCVLVFVGFGPAPPAPPIQRLVRELLASNLKNFAVSG
jgi:hypothetical protein